MDRSQRWKRLAIFFIIIFLNSGCSKDINSQRSSENGQFPAGEPPTSCTKVNEIVLETTAPTLKTIKIVPFKGDLSAEENYNYYSHSAHPEVGPTPKNRETHIYLYQDQSGMNLFLHHNADQSPWHWTRVLNKVSVSNNLLQDELILSDDHGEVERVSDGDKTIYYGDFQYSSNTDGMVIGPLQSKESVLQYAQKCSRGIDRVVFHSADGTQIDITEDESSVHSFEIKHIEKELCQST